MHQPYLQGIDVKKTLSLHHLCICKCMDLISLTALSCQSCIVKTKAVEVIEALCWEMEISISMLSKMFFLQLHNLWYIQYLCILAITKEKSRRHTTSTSCVMGFWCIAAGIIISVTLNPVLYKHTRTGINPLYMKRWCWWLMGPGHWLVNGSNEQLRCDPSNFDINHTNFLSA